MNQVDSKFKQYIQEILEEGVWSEHARPHYEDGTEAKSRYLTDVTMKWDLAKGEFPISQLRPIYIKKAIEEIFWIYQDQTSDLDQLERRGVTWWEEWALADHSIGERYGKTVKNYDIVDRTLKLLEENPWNRRAIMNLWQYRDLDVPAKLPPCAFMMQFDVRRKNGQLLLDGKLTQRSSDFLVAGLGINQMQYVALQMMFAKHLGFEVGTFSWSVMNLHIYDRHFEQAKALLKREPADALPYLTLDVPAKTNFYEIKPADFTLHQYEAVRPQLKFELAI